MKRKSVEGEYELLEQTAKRIASDPKGCIATNTVTTCTGESKGTAVLAQPVLPAQQEIMSVSNISSDEINVGKGENLLESQQQVKGSISGEKEGNLSDSPDDDDKFEESFEFLPADASTVDGRNSQTAAHQCGNPNETPLQPSGGHNTHTSKVVEGKVEILHETEKTEEALKNLSLGSPKADNPATKDVDQDSSVHHDATPTDKRKPVSGKDMSSVEPKKVKEVCSDVDVREKIPNSDNLATDVQLSKEDARKSKNKNQDKKTNQGSAVDVATNEEKTAVIGKELPAVKPKELGAAAVGGDVSTAANNLGIANVTRQEDSSAERNNNTDNNRQQEKVGKI